MASVFQLPLQVSRPRGPALERRLGPIEKPARFEKGRIAVGGLQSVLERATAAARLSRVDADRLGLCGRVGLDDVPLWRAVAGEVGTYELQGLVGEAVIVPDELSDVEIEIRANPLRWRGGDRGKRVRPGGEISFLR